MKLIFHGGALDVGRSCIELVTSQSRFLLDCGVKLGEETEYPEEPKAMKSIDAVFLTHAHLDHCGALPLFQKKGLKCPIYMHPGTKNIAKILMKDNLKVESLTHNPGYEKSNVYAAANLFKIKDFRQNLDVKDSKIKFYDAGHIPGSALVCIDVEGKRLLYTGDLNTSETRLMNGADLEIDDIDTLITETTYGAKEHPDRKQSEKELIAKIKETIKRGGQAVVPVFGLGRAQEILLLIQSEKWDVPVYLDGIAEDITNLVIQENTCRDNDKLAKARGKTIFIKGMNERQLALKTQGIFITTSGMLAGGPIIDYLKETYSNPLNSILLTGYVMETTNGGLLMKEGCVFLDGKKVKVKAEYKQFDFSAHAGMSELKQMIKTLNPRRVILIHGEPVGLENMANYVRSLGKEVFIPKPGSEINI